MVELINQSYYNKISGLINIANENVLTQKVKELSESYIFSIGSQTLFASLTLKAVCGISLSISFPICLALIAFISFKSLVINSIKEAIKALAEKGREYLTRIAQVISDIFETICSFISSFALQAIHLKDKALSFDKKLPITYAVITDTEPFTEESISYFVVPNLIAQSSVTLEKSAALAASIEEAPQIQEDTQIVTFAPPQKETPEIKEKAKKPEILSKFEQLCTKTPNYSLFYTEPQKFYKAPEVLWTPFKPCLTPKIPTVPRIVSPKPGRSSEAQGLITAITPTFNPSSIRLGMKVLNLVKKLK